ncbi:XylR N-terminal domain-containing protein [Bhargavaea cecembensis]|uniref:XylR N-terminal domain-containing protein n=1 Tax=Bhargavaea cecembensis TaxID=394098 RepID=UPI0009EEF583|nr:XylR N-terminal domain-containing protein [Bhargavaea cecembensis]
MEITDPRLERDISIEQNGLIYSDGNRAVIVPTSTFGVLRKDLYLNIGKDRVKGFLIRYGSDLGRKDAKVILAKYKGSPIEEIIRKGPVFHRLQGHVIPIITHLKVKQRGDKYSIYLEGNWEFSYEAEEHISQFGTADEPVCHTLVGYVSGFLTEISNQTVLMKEVSCTGAGDGTCRFVGRTSDYWTEDMHEELKYFTEEPIVKELELTFEKLLEERNRLKEVSTIYNKLTEEILRGKDLDSITDFVYRLTKTAILIENADLQPVASGGIPGGQLTVLNQEFKEFVQCKEEMKKSISRTKVIELDDHMRVTTPVVLQGKTIGYCSFICKECKGEDSVFLQMIIERISSICALYLLNKKTEAEAEDRMKGRFLEQILNNEFTKEEILRRSSFIGVDLFQPYYMVVVTFELFNQNYKTELAFHEEVMNRTSNYFKNRGVHILIGQQADDLVLLFLKSEIEPNGINATCQSYLEYLVNSFSQVTVRAGISLQSEEISRASVSYKEALTAVRMTSEYSPIQAFESLGILGPLINISNQEEVEKAALFTLRPLSQDLNDHKRMELIRTLYVYLQNGGNLEQTSSDLALSLSGLRYRIGKIEREMNQDLRNPEVSYKLMLSIQALISTGKITI